MAPALCPKPSQDALERAMAADNTVEELIFDSIESVIDDIRQGKAVIMVDDEDRENEGDIICAAAKVTPELVNFMAVHGRGLICVALDPERVHQLGLSPMPRVNQTPQDLGTAFLESVDALEGITTGISAADRNRSISLLASETASSHDLAKPGHIFPLQAHPKGVLGRNGHTEAAVDLARLAGLDPSGVICEVIKEDGDMARTQDLIQMAKQYGLKISSVEALVLHRQQSEELIHLEREVSMPTEYGEFRLRSYIHHLGEENHLALVKGEPENQEAPLVRVHSECLTGDAFGSLRCDCGVQLKDAMRLIAEEEHGVILYMRQEGRGIGLSPKLHAYELQEKGLDTVEANEALGFKADQRDYAISAQMLQDLNVQKIRLITNNPAKVSGLEQFGIGVSERISSVSKTNPHNEKYMQTKKDKMGHIL